MSLFVVVLLKRTIYNKETKREAESQNGYKKTLTADSAPDPNFFAFKIYVLNRSNLYLIKNNKLKQSCKKNWILKNVGELFHCITNQIKKLEVHIYNFIECFELINLEINNIFQTTSSRYLKTTVQAADA